MTEFAVPFPSSVFLRLVGLPSSVEMRDQFVRVGGHDPAHHHPRCSARGHRGADRGAHGGGQAIAQLPTVPAGRAAGRSGVDDLISLLIKAEMPGQRKLEPKEILNFAYVLVLAGLDTVTTAIGFQFSCTWPSAPTCRTA